MTTDTPRHRQLAPLPSVPLPQCLEFLKLKRFPLKVYPPIYKPPTLTQDTLYVHGPGMRGSWASFDVTCLGLQIYLKICGVEYNSCYSNEPASSPSGILPYLETVTGALYNHNEIHAWLEERNMDKPVPCGDGKAFLALVQSKLDDALLFSQWLEPIACDTTTSTTYFGHLPWVMRKWLLFQKQQSIVDQLLTRRDILVPEEVYQDAALALEALSAKLGDQTYFFGAESPTWIDAVVFSYLHIILSAPKYDDARQWTVEERRQVNTLRDLVSKHKNLVSYSKSMYEQWLK